MFIENAIDYLDNIDYLKKRINVEKLYYIYITKRSTNSIFSITDKCGNVVLQTSCGRYFSGTNKATIVAHIETCQQLASVACLLGIKKVFMVFKGTTRWNSTIFKEFSDFKQEIEDEQKKKKKKKKKNRNNSRKKMIYFSNFWIF